MANFNSDIVTALNTANNLQDAEEYLGNVKYIPVKFTTDHADMTDDTVTLTNVLPYGSKVIAVRLLHTDIASATQVDLGTVAEPDALIANENLTSAGTILFPEGATGDKTDGVGYDVGGEKLILTFNAGAMSGDSIEGYILISTPQ
jgi:hypothetical protein|tara:strand:- start:129 stop:566 length:438 start_codon:yes stop_codon:yes gene_type:complete